MVSMRLSFVGFVAALASMVSANNNGPSDASILQYALTLEHLEARFYQLAAAKFQEADYAAAGYQNPQALVDRTNELAYDERTHVNFLTAGLKAAGANPVKACQYDFTAALSTVDSYLATSRILEGVGVSAYLGAAKDISNKDYLTAAGAILTVEARHQAVISEINGQLGFPSPFDTPLNYDEVYSLAAPFIKSCPKSNAKLPADQAFKSLVIKSGTPGPGKKITVQLPSKVKEQPYLIVLNGLTETAVKVNKKTGQATLPKGISGTVYLVLATCDHYIQEKVISFGLVQLPSDAAPLVTSNLTK